MPNEQKVTRELRAILSADVKGYSLLMADDGDRINQNAEVHEAT